MPPTPALQGIVARLLLLLVTASAHSTAAFHGTAPSVTKPTHNTSWYTMAWGRSKAPKPDEATLISSLKDAVKAEPQDSSFPVDDACVSATCARATTT